MEIMKGKTKLIPDRVWCQYTKFFTPVKKIKIKEKTVFCVRDPEWEVVSIEVSRDFDTTPEEIIVRIRKKSDDKFKREIIDRINGRSNQRKD